MYRRAASVRLTTLGRELVDRLFPEHTERVSDAFAVLDEAEKRIAGGDLPQAGRRACGRAAYSRIYWAAMARRPVDSGPVVPRTSRSRCSSAGASATSSPSRCAAARAPSRGSSTRARRPPTAGPASHHVLARVFKDIYPRYQTMRGYHVERKGGWDCHGLPVEIAVEQQLGIDEQARDRGLRDRRVQRERCRESVFEYLEDWNALTERIGFWVDLDDAYRTLDATYIESVWWALRQIHDKGLLYEGHKVVPYCPRCGTALSSARGGAGLPGRRRPVGLRALPGRRGRRAAAGRRRAARLDDDAVDAGLQRGGRRRPRADVRARQGGRRWSARSCWPRRSSSASSAPTRASRSSTAFPGAALDGVRYEPPFAFLGRRVRRARPHACCSATSSPPTTAPASSTPRSPSARTTSASASSTA